MQSRTVASVLSDIKAEHIAELSFHDCFDSSLGEMYGALRDRTGALWFSFETGPARLVPEPDPSPVPPPILITGLRIAGEAHAISVRLRLCMIVASRLMR